MRQAKGLEEGSVRERLCAKRLDAKWPGRRGRISSMTIATANVPSGSKRVR